MRRGWYTLGGIWAVLAVGAVAGVGALEVLGPPPPDIRPAAPLRAPKRIASLQSERPLPEARPEPPDGLSPTTGATIPSAPEPPPAPAIGIPSVVAPANYAIGGPIPGPDPALLEPSPIGGDLKRPRIAADGRISATAYARVADPADRRPRVALLIVGFGLSAAESSVAMAALPGGVTLGFSPYSVNPEPLLREAHAEGHEYLVTLPMESQGYPLSQSGSHALLTGNEPAVNGFNLQWVLSRMQGEVGLTGASDGLRGERFASASAPFNAVLAELGARGLLYLDARPNAKLTPPRGVSVAGTTMVIDDPPVRAEIDAKLAALEQQARDTGAAVGVAGPLRPVVVDRVAAWARGLDARGIVLVPVSAVAKPL